MPSLYLAGPIDLVLPGQKLGFHGELKQLFSADPSVVFYNPAPAFTVATKDALDPHGMSQDVRQYIEAVNTHAIDMADLFVGVFMRDVPSVGTPIELDFAFTKRKTIYVISDIPYGHSVYLSNRVNPKNYYCTREPYSSGLVQAVAKSIKDYLSYNSIRPSVTHYIEDPDHHEYND